MKKDLALIATIATGLLIGSVAGVAAQSDDREPGTTPKLPAPFGAAGNGLIAYVSGGDIWTVEPTGDDPHQITFATSDPSTSC